MIVSASYRTDIPAFYGAWFRRRLAAGFCLVRNPYGGAPYRVPLAGPGVDGFVFWTRNIAPFEAALDEVTARKLPFVVQYTVTAYPRALELSVADTQQSMKALRALAARHGPRVVVWRYDPVLITTLTPAAWHRETFARLADSVVGASDEVVLSHAHIYEKTRRNLDRAAAAHGFTWRDPQTEEKQALLQELAELAAERGLRASLCAQSELLVPGLAPARCIDAHRLSAIAQRAIDAPTRGNRPGCLCAQSRDIGAYDTCPHGCVYCYAVRDRAAAKARYKRHDPAATALSAG